MKLKIGIILSLFYLSLINSEELISTDGLNVVLVDQIQVSEFNELGEKVKTIENFYKIKNDAVDFSEKLDQIRVKFNNDQNYVFKKFGDNIQEYQNARNKNLQFYNDKVNFLANRKFNNLKSLSDQQLNIERDIVSVQEYMQQENEKFYKIARNAVTEYNSKLQALHEKKYLLNALLTQHCEDCDEIKNYELDVHYAQNDAKILELQKNFLKQADENKKLADAMELENTKKLNSKYLELNVILQKKIDEYASHSEVDEQNGNIINEWKIYTQNIEVLYSFVESKISDIFNGSLNINYNDNSSVLSNYENKARSEDVLDTTTQQDSPDYNTFNSDDNNNENIDTDVEDGNPAKSETEKLNNISSILTNNTDVGTQRLNVNDEDDQLNTDDESNQSLSPDDSQNELPESTSEISVSNSQKCFLNRFSGIVSN